MFGAESNIEGGKWREVRPQGRSSIFRAGGCSVCVTWGRTYGIRSIELGGDCRWENSSWIHESQVPGAAEDPMKQCHRKSESFSIVIHAGLSDLASGWNYPCDETDKYIVTRIQHWNVIGISKAHRLTRFGSDLCTLCMLKQLKTSSMPSSPPPTPHEGSIIKPVTVPSERMVIRLRAGNEFPPRVMGTFLSHCFWERGGAGAYIIWTVMLGSAAGSLLRLLLISMVPSGSFNKIPGQDNWEWDKWCSWNKCK